MELVVSAKVVVAWLGLLQCECDTDERGDGDAKLFNFSGLTKRVSRSVAIS